MTTTYKIPFTAKPQEFSILLGQTTYQVTLKWNWVASSWVLDFADDNGAPILQGVPLVTGADLLAQYAYLEFGGYLIAQTDNDPTVPPTYSNLGTDSNVYFTVP